MIQKTICLHSICAAGKRKRKVGLVALKVFLAFAVELCIAKVLES